MRRYTGATYFEVSFLQYLVLMQFFSLFTVYIATFIGYAGRLTQRPYGPGIEKRVVVLTLYFALNMVLLVINFFEFGVSYDRIQDVNQIFAGCSQYDGVEFAYVGLTPQSLTARLVIYLVGLPLGVILFAGMTRLLLMFLFWVTSRFPWLSILLLLILYGATIVWTLAMMGTRYIMQDIATMDFQDDQ